MSAEDHRRQLLRRAAFWRFVTDVADASAVVIRAVGNGVDKVGMAAFYLESDSARQYRDLTGLDLGEMVAEPNRYNEVAKVADDEEDD